MYPANCVASIEWGRYTAASGKLKVPMSRKQSIEKYAKKAVKLGAEDAKLICTETVVTAQWVRMKCQYGCDGYGQCLTCPPYSPTPAEAADIIANYRTAILIHGCDHTDLTAIAAKLERKAFLDGYYKAFAMGSGPCRLCEECDLENKECTHPYQARPAMEACGIDVFQTVRKNGFPIEVVKNENCEQDYYAIVLLE